MKACAPIVLGLAGILSCEMTGHRCRSARLKLLKLETLGANQAADSEVIENQLWTVW